MQSLSRFLPFLCAISLPLAVQLLWLLTNTQLPISDATGSYLASYNIAQLAFEGKWQEFITGLYTMRDWRPTSLCLVLLPFALVSGGSLMFMAAGLSLACLLISVTYVYHLLRLALSPYHAALGAAMLGLMPAIQHPATYFGYTEVPFMAAILAALYHLLRTEHFSNRNHAYCMAMAATLAFTLRPIETLFHYIPVLGLCMWQAWHHGKVSCAEIVTAVTISAVCACVLVIAGWWPHGLFVFPESAIFDGTLQGTLFAWVGSATFMITAVLLALLMVRVVRDPHWRTALRTSSFLLPSSGAISVGVCLFYFSFMTPLVQWIYITNLGDLGSVVAPRPVSEKLAHFVFGTGLLPLATLALLFLYVVIPAQAGIHPYKLVAPKALRWIPACAGMTGEYRLLPLLAAIPIPLLLPFFTCQFSQRKVTILFICLLVVLMSLALQKGRLHTLRTAAVMALALWQAVGVGWISMGMPHTPLLSATVGSRAGFSEMVTTRPNPHDTVVDFLITRAKRYGYHSISLPILGGEVPRLVDPFLLVILTKIKTKESLVFFPHINREKETMISSPRHLFGGDAFLVAADRKLEYTPQEAARLRADGAVSWLPSDKVAYEILALHIEGKLEALGVRKRECTVIAPTEVEVCLYDYK